MEKHQASKGFLSFSPINLDMYNIPNSSSRPVEPATVATPAKIAVSGHPNDFLLAFFQPNAMSAEGQQQPYRY